MNGIHLNGAAWITVAVFAAFLLVLFAPRGRSK